MNERQTSCDPRRIELFLEQQLSDEEQSSFEEHLGDRQFAVLDGGL